MQPIILGCIYTDSMVQRSMHGSVVASSMLTKPSHTYPFHANPAAFNRGIRPDEKSSVCTYLADSMHVLGEMSGHTRLAGAWIAMHT